MAVGVPEYTGLGAGGVLQKSTGERTAQATQDMLQTVLETEKFKYGERKKEEAEFLKNVYIKPEYLISAKARTEMAMALQSFSDKWYKINAQHKGILPFRLKTQMQNERTALEMAQNDLLQNMGQWKVLNDAVVKDGGVDYDMDEWNQITEEFLRTGRINVTSPPIKGYDFASYIAGESKKITTEYPGRVYDKGGMRYAETINMQNEQAITDFIKSSALKDPRAVKGLAKEFAALPMETKRIYLEDLNRDQILDNKDIDSNAIVRWAAQNPRFREAAINRQTTQRNIPRPVGGVGTEGTSVGGAQVKLTPGKQTPGEPKKFGDREYSQTQSFRFGGNAPIYGIPTRGGKALNASWTDEEIASGVINGNLRLYDPTKKVFLVESVTQSESADQKSRTLLEIPEENIMDFENIPIEYIGNVMTIGRYRKLMEEMTPMEKSTTTPPKPTKGKLY